MKVVSIRSYIKKREIFKFDDAIFIFKLQRWGLSLILIIILFVYYCLKINVRLHSSIFGFTKDTQVKIVKAIIEQ